jgi:hypothetical protein
VKLEASKTISGVRRWILDVNPSDLERADFIDFDRMLFRDVEENAGDRGTPIADWLLALETMARRIEEATP